MVLFIHLSYSTFAVLTAQIKAKIHYLILEISHGHFLLFIALLFIVLLLHTQAILTTLNALYLITDTQTSTKGYNEIYTTLTHKNKKKMNTQV